VSVLRRVVIADTDQAAEARARQAWAALDANLTKLFRHYDIWPPHVPSFRGDYEMGVATETVVAGSPARIAEHFHQITEEVDTDHIMVCLSWGDLAGDEALPALDLFAEYVIGQRFGR
jgi:alkanesulfonate monooxygenase SsuD/methylene tetrahydromethanopterin reductase-like flavin-dependent oxidoreductase (luciferase family)